MTIRLTTVDEVIGYFGLDALTSWAGYESTSGVCNWRHRGIPPGLQVRLFAEAVRRGVVLDPAVYVLEDHDIETLRPIFEAAAASAAA